MTRLACPRSRTGCWTVLAAGCGPDTASRATSEVGSASVDSPSRPVPLRRRLGGVCELLENAGPAAGHRDLPSQLFGAGAEPLDVPVLKVDLGLTVLLGEQHLDLAGVLWVGVVLKLTVELPGHDEAGRRVVREHLAPVALRAVNAALVPAPASLGLKHGLGQVGLADVVADPPGVEPLGEELERLLSRDRHRHLVPHRGDRGLVHDYSCPSSATACCAANS